MWFATSNICPCRGCASLGIKRSKWLQRIQTDQSLRWLFWWCGHYWNYCRKNNGRWKVSSCCLIEIIQLFLGSRLTFIQHWSALFCSRVSCCLFIISSKNNWGIVGDISSFGSIRHSSSQLVPSILLSRVANHVMSSYFQDHFSLSFSRRFLAALQKSKNKRFKLN